MLRHGSTSRVGVFTLAAGAALASCAPLVAGTTTAQGGDPSQVGQWAPPQGWPVIAIHAAMLASGKVLYYAYPAGGAMTWDPSTGIFEKADMGTDLFCSGLAQLGDGNIFVAGGNDYDCDFQGRYDTHVYNPFSESWTRLDDMVDGRWYPTNTTLGDGRVVIMSGLNRLCETNPRIEMYTPGEGLTLIGNRFMSLYPRLHLLTSGEIAHVGSESNTFLFDPEAGNWQFVDGTNFGWRPNNTTVLVPGREDQVMTIAGSNEANPTATCEIIDFASANPQWQWVAPMNNARAHHNATILPDATILVIGGGVSDLYWGPVNVPELYDPDSNTWTELPEHVHGRMYHSTTVLLPDGRVVAAGQDHGASAFTGEIYSPAYLFRGPRPQITQAPTSIAYGKPFTIQSPEAAEVASACLIAPTTVTHQVNTGQRYVGLQITSVSGNQITLAAPPDGNHAPPGYYMLFILDGDKVPSIAEMVRVGDTLTADLTDFAVVFGSHVGGNLAKVAQSDGTYLRTRSAHGFTAFEPNLMEIHFGADAGVTTAGTIDITIESRLNNPDGLARVRLRDWGTGLFEQVGQYPIGTTYETVSIEGIDATDTIRADDGRMELSVRHSVIATFSLAGFDSFFDLVRMLVG